MLDIKFIRENPEKVKQLIKAGRGKVDKADIDKLLELDTEIQKTKTALDELRKARNLNAKQSGQKPGPQIIEKGRQLKEDINKLEKELDELSSKWQEILDWIPNMPQSDSDMPDGNSEQDNLVIKAWVPDSGYVKGELGKATLKSDYMPERSLFWDAKLKTPKHHLEIGKNLGIIDNEQSAKTSGSRFTYLIGDGALLQFALQRLMFEELLKRNFKPIIPPLLVYEKVLYGTSHFPESRDQVYGIDTEFVEDNQKLFLVGSSEPANFAYFMDRTLTEEELPIRLFAYTTCFRSEAGSWGKDTKGIKRLHQFDKIEMNVICRPEESDKIFDELLGINEWLLQTLEIPYRLTLKCKADAGYLASAKQVDPEGWLPGQQEFIELETDTNTTDFQARRLNIRYRDKNGTKKFVHTVNDTGIAMGRMIIAILDNYQQSDGSIKVPKALVPFIAKEKIIRQ